MAKRFPFSGLPTGWYTVGHSAELAPRGVLTRHYFDQDLVLYRTEAGHFHATTAYCPHLGAHLGQGSVTGEVLQCKFHGFRFDREGQCIGTSYPGGRPPRHARVEHFRAEERDGQLLVFYDALGRRPDWPAPELDLEGYTGFRWKRLSLESHPQETCENSVDIGHFGNLHGFVGSRSHRIESKGNLLRSQYSIKWPLAPFGMPNKAVDAHFDVYIHGLGYSLVRVEIPLFALRAQLLINATPIDESHIDLHVACAVERHRSGAMTRALQFAMHQILLREIAADAPIWAKKRYEMRPALAEGDGEIATFRRWALQFYPPEGSAAARAPAGAPAHARAQDHAHDPAHEPASGHTSGHDAGRASGHTSAHASAHASQSSPPLVSDPAAPVA